MNATDTEIEKIIRTTIMEDMAKRIGQMLRDVNKRVKATPEDILNMRPAPGKWSKKEVLGHLIDSAANNHQRFVRVQIEDTPLIRYDQDKWVAVQDYYNIPVNQLLELWISYNKHICAIIQAIPEENYEKLCNVGEKEPVTLAWLVKDYVKHIEHHLRQL
jgi:hypothetical protein